MKKFIVFLLNQLYEKPSVFKVYTYVLPSKTLRHNSLKKKVTQKHENFNFHYIYIENNFSFFIILYMYLILYIINQKINNIYMYVNIFSRCFCVTMFNKPIWYIHIYSNT